VRASQADLQKTNNANNSGDVNANAGDANAVVAVVNTSVVSESDTVHISQEAREKLKDEEKAMASGDEAEEIEGAEEAEEGEIGLSLIDQLIIEMQKKIADLQEQLEELIGEDDEASQMQVKMLQDQISTYSGRLMDLIKLKEKLLREQSSQ
jgi:hypothetical protein